MARNFLILRLIATKPSCLSIHCYYGNVKRSCCAASHSSVHLSENCSAAVAFQQYTGTDYCSDCSEDVDAQEYSDIEEDGHPSSRSMAEETNSNSTAQSSESGADEIISDNEEEIQNFELGDEEELQQPDYSNNASQLPSGAQEKLSQELYIKKIIIRISLFLTFFQLYYRISERGISLLLAFLKSLLSWFCSLCPESLTLRLLAVNMPKNVYFLKKNWLVVSLT